MGTTLSTLSPPRGAKSAPKRLGRGPGSGLGTTAGRGQKGQRARNGVNRSSLFEGGQMPLQRRIPKRGFKNPFRVSFFPVNLGQLAQAFGPSAIIDPEILKAKGMMPRSAKRLKVLGDGEPATGLKIKAHAFSASAIEKLQSANGSMELIPMPGQAHPVAQP